MATAPAIEEDNPRIRIGANSPPSMKETALIEVEEALKPLRARATELLESAEKAKADDVESAGKCADLVKMIRACHDAIDKARKATQKPYDDAIGVMRDAPRKVLLELSSAKRKVEEMGIAFDRKERARLADVQKLKDEQDARDRSALEARAESMGVELPPEEPKKEPARGKPIKAVQSDMGSSFHTRKIAVFTVTDPYALPLDILNHEKVQAAIISVARELYRADPTGKIKGILVTEDETSVVR
tara:strand:- start:1165 stop:1899 length:735 start_codon:yes stop_codon:yes gene_type:complete